MHRAAAASLYFRVFSSLTQVGGQVMNLDSIDHCHAVVGSSPKVMGVNSQLDLCSHTMLPNFFHGHNLSIYLLLLLRLIVMLDSYLNKNKSKYET